MTHHIIKPLPTEDFYCDWHVETNHPEVWGDRAYMLAQGADELRLRRADRQGSSCWDGYRRWTEQSPDEEFPMSLAVHPEFMSVGSATDGVVSIPRHALRDWLTAASEHGDPSYDLAAVQHDQSVDFYDAVEAGTVSGEEPPVVDYRPLVRQAQDETMTNWIDWMAGQVERNQNRTEGSDGSGRDE